MIFLNIFSFTTNLLVFQISDQYYYNIIIIFRRSYALRLSTKIFFFKTIGIDVKRGDSNKSDFAHTI